MNNWDKAGLLVVCVVASTLLLTACEPSGEKVKSESSSPYVMTCEQVKSGLDRCENKEVVCYADRGQYHESLQCRFK